ncbi:5-hydroxytryptamine receptor 1D-like [Paramacrobiotus metropolitanus]|uniref:5-hydroxytryptamine receptor 1D-like n=1 Tax=Paramacrobiotus metropolitanus TaxID=2943436 RepID=UPI0024462FF1|nr:5-hydroxytryptamine receptor 1D-like [Paramacrobiotus metropolitanus]
MNNTELSNNASNISSSSPAWTLGPTSTAIITPLAIILNGYVLFIFLTNKSLHIPFNVYLGSLLFANLVYSILCNPLDVISALYPTWPLSFAGCNVYIYALLILGAVTINSHALITVNRLWAVTFPVSYRNHHSLRAAFATVVALWIYVHVICLPGVIRDSLYFRAPLSDNPCLVNVAAQFEWNLMMQFVAYDLPIVFVIVAYPYLLIKHKLKRRVKFIVAVPLGINATKPRRAWPTHSNSAQNRSTGSSGLRKKALSDDQRRAFFITTLLTVSLCVCWVPNVAFFTVASFMQVDEPVLYGVLSFLFNLQSLLDPLFFAFVFKGLREALLAPLPKCSGFVLK